MDALQDFWEIQNMVDSTQIRLRTGESDSNFHTFPKFCILSFVSSFSLTSKEAGLPWGCVCFLTRCLFWHCYWTQLWLPTATKGNTSEVGVGVQKRGLFKYWQPEKMGESCSKAHLSISMQAGVFIRRERESRTRQEEGLWMCRQSCTWIWSWYGSLMPAYRNWSVPATFLQ